MATIIVENIFFLTIIVLSIFIIFLLKDKVKVKKICKIICYTIIALIIFFTLLYFLNDSCHYADSIKDAIPSWWFLYFSLLTQLEIILFLIEIFLVQIILSKTEDKKVFYILSFILCVFSLAFMHKNKICFKDQFYTKKDLVHLYKMDKMALLSLKKKKYIYVIAENMDKYYAIDEGNETMPGDLKTKKYKNKIYFFSDGGPKKLPYLEYLEEVYDVEADKKIIFDTEENIINKLKKDNLQFSPTELNNPEFETIEELYGGE